MVLPHFKKGFIPIAQEIAKALMRTNLSAYQSRILWAIFRKTYGYQKTEDWISNSQFVDLTKIRKGHVSRSLKELIDRNMVTKAGRKLSFQEDSSQWHPLPKGVTSHRKLPGKVTQLPKGGPKSYQRGSTQKKKRKYAKKSEISKSFKKFNACSEKNKEEILSQGLDLKYLFIRLINGDKTITARPTERRTAVMGRLMIIQTSPRVMKRD
jgi:phage replication O-like protein O